MTMTMTLLVGVTVARPSRSRLDDETAVGCRRLGLCCRGRNVTCSSTVSDDATSTSTSTSTCFCDEECLTLADCCSDYRAVCRPVDCLLADDWQPWSDCDSRCGYGVQVRVRQTVVDAVNGGQPCGETVQRRLCQGTQCKLARSQHGAVSQLKETAGIVPASYAAWRSDALYSPLEDIRQNLFTHVKYDQFRHDHSQPSYCAKFEVTETRSSCRRHDWTRRLRRGAVVCVECQQFTASAGPRARRRCVGHGVYDRQTDWNAVGVRRCHGKWTLVSRHLKPCQCDPRATTSFVFV